MAIKSNSGEKITATDINTLIDKIQEEYNTRTITTTGTDRSGANASVNLKTLGESLHDVNKNDTIGSNLYNIVNTILVMNDVPNLRINEQYDIIISDGINNNADLKDSLPTTCRGACLGTCSSGCSGQEKSNSSGTSGTTGTTSQSMGNSSPYGSPGAGCSDCTGYCVGECLGCWGQCSGGCYGLCYTACSNHCGTGCMGCSGTCSGECDGGCGNSCKNNCDANCTNGCALNCKDGCYGSAKANEQGINTYT